MRRLAIVLSALASLATMLVGSIFLRPNYGFQCECQYGRCGCYPIGTPRITPQQPTPQFPTFQPHTPPPVVTPPLPQPPPIALPTFAPFNPPTLPPNPVPPTPTRLPPFPTGTTLPVPPTPTRLPPIAGGGGACPLIVRRDYESFGEVYIIYYFSDDPTQPNLTINISSSLLDYDYVNGAHVWTVRITAPIPPSAFVVEITIGALTFRCSVLRSG